MSDVQKVVISECFGGFGLSPAAVAGMQARGWDGKYDRDVERDDPRLVAVVEELGTRRASGGFAELVVVEVPAGVKWHVHEYDGAESVHEDHRTWHSSGESESC